MKRKKTMSKRARDELVSGIALRYAKADRKGKGIILDEAVKDTGYNRKYLIHKLRGMASSAIRKDIGGREHKVAYRKQPGRTGRKGRPREYDEALRASLVSIWHMFDMMCSKRLMKLIRDNITSISAYPPFRVTPEIGSKLLSMSPATADRLRRLERERMRLRGKSGTRSPGSSLNALIPVRAYYSFDEPRSPYERIMMDKSVPGGCKEGLRQDREECRLIPLKQAVALRQKELLALAVREGRAEAEENA